MRADGRRSHVCTMSAVVTRNAAGMTRRNSCRVGHLIIVTDSVSFLSLGSFQEAGACSSWGEDFSGVGLERVQSALLKVKKIESSIISSAKDAKDRDHNV